MSFIAWQSSCSHLENCESIDVFLNCLCILVILLFLQLYVHVLHVRNRSWYLCQPYYSSLHPIRGLQMRSSMILLTIIR